MNEEKNKEAARGGREERPAAFEIPEAEKRIEIDFLFLDRDLCDPGNLTEQSVDGALAEVSALLRTAGFEIELRKIPVNSLEEAFELGFYASPTIRVNGEDLALHYRKTPCCSCGEASAEESSCRVWDFHGGRYRYLPKTMLVGAILLKIYGDEKNLPAGYADTATDIDNIRNLERFFRQKRTGPKRFRS
ncbi:MAG: DUF2703 domain-containing protein [Acidobacteria bacterium]|nr:DUF2703 domain-containing protein [Acidobacteriota bacterium]